MKKFIYAFALVGLFVFAVPKVADACTTEIILCQCDGSQHYAVVCDPGDRLVWGELLCCPQEL